jgi:hypothetical protein
LVEIIDNLKNRIQEARLNGWVGEIQGLQVSLDAAAKKVVSLDRMRAREDSRSVNFGMPVISNSH